MRVPFFIFVVFAGLGFAWATPKTQDQLDLETRRRESQIMPLVDSIKQGDLLVAQGEPSKAIQLVEKVYQNLPEGLRNGSAGIAAKKKLSDWLAQAARSAAQRPDWPEARRLSLSALKYNSSNEVAHSLLLESEEILRRGASPGEKVNSALSSKFFSRLQNVQDNLKKAEDLRSTGQLEDSERAYEEVLKVDPFNEVATGGIRKIYQERSLVAAQARDISNLERRREVRESWNNIYPKKNMADSADRITGPLTASSSFQLGQKLKSIVIPEVSFSGADLESIRRALISLSRQYDSDPNKTGVNFVVSADIATAQPVSLKLRQTSLGDVVRYVAQIAGVKWNLTDVGVKFSPLIETSPDLIPREFLVSSSFWKSTNTTASSSGVSSPRGSGGGNVAEPSETGGGLSEQAKLEELGVKFPPGSFAVYNRNTKRLRVVNNAEMLDLIGQLIAAAEEQTLLIQVGVRLVEINQNDLDSITANSTLAGSPLSVIPAGLTTNNQGPVAVTGAGWNAQLNQIQGVGLLPNNTLQSFLQQGVLAGTNQTSSYSLNTMELGGTILNGMQLRTLITAISQKNSANVLANPSIVLKRGQEGVIEVSQEFRYVKEYNDPQSSIRTFVPVANLNNPLGGTVTLVSVPGPETVISSFPSQASDPVPIGVKMGVKPDVTGDNSRVLLELKPSFVDFEGFINYGTQINSAYAATYYEDTVTILTNNIQQPVFIKRDLTLPAVEVGDGHTLMLGGLLREDIQKIDEKVPIIGDIPFFGRAFQGKTEQAFKKNTLIFVTPRILNVDGSYLNPTAGAPTTAATVESP